MFRFKPESGANLNIGRVGTLESVEEDRIEVTCKVDLVDMVVNIIKSVPKAL